eukprot:363516-Chlamydomonas_euryale.AAC.21
MRCFERIFTAILSFARPPSLRRAGQLWAHDSRRSLPRRGRTGVDCAALLGPGDAHLCHAGRPPLTMGLLRAVPRCWMCGAPTTAAGCVARQQPLRLLGNQTLHLIVNQPCMNESEHQRASPQGCTSTQ